MKFDFCEIFQKNVFKIGKFLYEESLIRMREVSKSANEVVVVSILSLRKTNVYSLQVIPNIQNNRTLFTFSFEDEKDFPLWKMVLLSAPDVQIEIINEVLKVIMKSDKVKDFCEYLKPIILNAQCQKLCLYDEPERVFKDLADLLERNCVETVIIDLSYSNNAYNSEVLELIQKLKPETLLYFPFRLLPELMKSIMKLADLVKSMRIYLRRQRDSNIDVISMTREILSRKCENFEFFENYDIPSITLTDIERLIQSFHNSEKRLYFASYTNAEVMEEQIGVYGIKIHNVGSVNYVSIKHLEKDAPELF